MKAILHITCCAVAASMIHGVATAQRIPLAAAVEAAWERSVQARSAQGQLGLAAAQVKAAASLWAAPPSLELAHRSDRLQDNAGRTESELGISWPLLLPGQRDARQAAAGAEHALAEASVAAAKLRLAGEVREAAWALVAREAEASLAQRGAQSLQALSDDVERRVRSGDLARADALAARAEFLAAAAAAADARQRLDAAKWQWKALTGLDPIADPAEPAAGGQAAQPELVLAALATESARSKLELARASRREPPELALRYRREVPLAGLPAEKSIGLAIRIPLGTEDRNLPREQAAIAELETARAEEQRQKLRLETEGAAARSAVAISEERLAADANRTELLRERAALLEKSFRAGEAALPELLRARSAAAEAEASLAAQRAALGLARARLKQINGQLP